MDDLESPTRLPDQNKAMVLQPAKTEKGYLVESSDLLDPLNLNEAVYREERRNLLKGKNVPEAQLSKKC